MGWPSRAKPSCSTGCTRDSRRSEADSRLSPCSAARNRADGGVWQGKAGRAARPAPAFGLSRSREAASRSAPNRPRWRTLQRCGRSAACSGWTLTATIRAEEGKGLEKTTSLSQRIRTGQSFSGASKRKRAEQRETVFSLNAAAQPVERPMVAHCRSSSRTVTRSPRAGRSVYRPHGLGDPFLPLAYCPAARSSTHRYPVPFPEPSRSPGSWAGFGVLSRSSAFRLRTDGNAFPEFRSLQHLQPRNTLN